MDALERDDLERSRATAAADKLAQALESMAAGLRLQRARLERDHPEASPERVQKMFGAWLRRDG